MEKRYLSVKEVCELTGLSKSTIYCEIYKRCIPYFKLGPRIVRFDREEIEEWIKNRPFKPMKTAIQERRDEWKKEFESRNK